jgi:hypothetical protein
MEKLSVIDALEPVIAGAIWALVLNPRIPVKI